MVVIFKQRYLELINFWLYVYLTSIRYHIQFMYIFPLFHISLNNSVADICLSNSWTYFIPIIICVRITNRVREMHIYVKISNTVWILHFPCFFSFQVYSTDSDENLRFSLTRCSLSAPSYQYTTNDRYVIHPTLIRHVTLVFLPFL